MLALISVEYHPWAELTNCERGCLGCKFTDLSHFTFEPVHHLAVRERSARAPINKCTPKKYMRAS